MENPSPPLKNLAAQNAARKTPSAKGPVSGLTSYDDLMGDDDVTVIRTSSGFSFQIEPIDPGEHFLAFASPLQEQYFAGIDLQNKNELDNAVANLSDEAKTEIVTNEDYIECVRRVVCAGVVNINFVMKRKSACKKYKREVSIYRLKPLSDLYEVFNAIMELSGEEVEDLQNFRGAGQPGNADSVSSDGEGVQSETVPSTVSQEDQPAVSLRG